MTDPRRRAASAARRVAKALADRDTAIVDMRAGGASLREIAEAVELTHTAVANILNREGVR